MILYRPVGANEYALIEQSGFTRFPPRLPGQPIFYPVTNEKYASEIAEKWNLKYNAEHKSYVLKFEVRDDFIRKYKPRTVGASYHEEYWIPAEELDEFNNNIVGQIGVYRVFEETGGCYGNH